MRRSVHGTGHSGALRLLDVAKVWDGAPHCAFVDLIRHRDRWVCTFRESDRHVGGDDGRIRVLASDDGERWTSEALLQEKGVDLRDPKLSIAPDGRLMMVLGGSVYRDAKLQGRRPRISFSSDGRRWDPFRPILQEGDWLWRVTWHAGLAYGVTYDATRTPWRLRLVASRDGVDYEDVSELDVPDQPNETTLRVAPDAHMLALVRREGGDRRGWIGRSKPPYRDWQWHRTDHRLGGPNVIVLPDGAMWAASRDHRDPLGPRTALASFGPEHYDPALVLPSGGDTGYPGLVWHDGVLWVAYYSSHEASSCIYLARVAIGTSG